MDRYEMIRIEPQPEFWVVIDNAIGGMAVAECESEAEALDYIKIRTSMDVVQSGS